MANKYGPWATLIDVGGNPQLSRVLEKKAEDARAGQSNQPGAIAAQFIAARGGGNTCMPLADRVFYPGGRPGKKAG